MMVEKNCAEVPLSLLEYRASFREPIFEAWDQRGAMARSLFQAFREWNVKLEDISGKQIPTDASEIQMTVHLFSKSVSFNVGLGAVSLFVNNPTWKEADLITKVAHAGIEAVRVITKVEINSQRLTLSMHLKPQGRPVRDITSDFVSPHISSVAGGPVRAFGFSVYTDTSSWVVDLSALYPEALFVRLDRFVGPETPLGELANTLYKDETDVLELLGLRLD